MTRGKRAESALEHLFGILERTTGGSVCVRKVDPPTYVRRIRGRQISIGYKRNPYLDFTGSYYGRRVDLECKDIDRDRLPIDVHKGDGIKGGQVQAIRRWVAAGSLVAVVWWRKGEVRFLLGKEVLGFVDDGEKSAPWSEAWINAKLEALLKDIIDAESVSTNVHG